MNYARSVTAADLANDCPVSPDLLGQIVRAEGDAFADLLDAIPDPTRARLAVWLYSRSHTHEIGVRIAATCDSPTLSRAAGFVGSTLYDLSRRPYAPPSHGINRPSARRISLGGSRVAA